MLTSFQWLSVFTILAATFAGGNAPLRRAFKAKKAYTPVGEAFTSGVFLALSLTLMLPSSSHLLNISFPKSNYPLGSGVAIVAFLALLAIEHLVSHLQIKTGEKRSPIIPITMTIMIAIPSFFLGTALGVSDTASAVMIWVAILIHKSSAAFALALKLKQSSLTQKRTIAIFTLFACSTPFGIITGHLLHSSLGTDTITVVKGLVLGLAAGTFLYMATINEFKNSALIKDCSHLKSFFAMMLGLIVTAFVRFLIGEAHQL